MIISNLKLVSLGHCFIQLPKTVHEKIDVGSIVTIRSVRNDDKILRLIWDGTFTDNDQTIIDKHFADINQFIEEPIVIDNTHIDKRLCTSCHVRLMDPNEIEIINEHFSTNLLDRCRLVYKDLNIPIWLSDHVKVSVKIIHVEPIGGPVELSQWTEVQIEDVVKTNKVEEPSRRTLPKPSNIKVHLLITGPRGSGKTFRLNKLAKEYNIDIINCKQLRGKRLESIKKMFEDPQPMLLLDNIDSIVGLEESSLHQQRLVDWFCGLFKHFERSDGNFQSIICTCQSYDSLDPRISQSRGRRYFNRIEHIEEPNLSERCDILKCFLEKHNASSNLSVDDFERLAKSCKTFSPKDIGLLVDRAMIAVCSRSLSQFDTEPVNLELTDFEHALDGYTPINMRNVNLKPKSLKTFDDIGGMGSIKNDLLKLILRPLKYPNLYSRSPIKPQTSVLLYGPPGCGKTLIADALTNQADINSICIRGPELLSKYIGSSEAAVRDLFKKAQLAKPCIIFFDEFESLVARRGSDSTGVTDRVVNQFLTLMDGFDELSHDIFIVAASSRPDMIDPAILRPGRIDKHLYCAYPDADDRLDILKVVTRRMNVNLDMQYLARERLRHFTGADIHSLMYSAQIRAFNEMKASDQTTKTMLIDDKHVQESLNEMLDHDNIEIKFKKTIQRHPENFQEMSNGVVSSRATLM